VRLGRPRGGWEVIPGKIREKHTTAHWTGGSSSSIAGETRIGGQRRSWRGISCPAERDPHVVPESQAYLLTPLLRGRYP